MSRHAKHLFPIEEAEGLTIKFVSFEATCCCGFKTSDRSAAKEHIQSCKVFSAMPEAAKEMVKEGLQL